ncbi:MAG: hypothetical protein QOE83_1162 [Actinomycetota bacterium]|jgi:hypothetical protein|nr:hypothetical protein [Actinomycetota bacterium]
MLFAYGEPPGRWLADHLPTVADQWLAEDPDDDMGVMSLAALAHLFAPDSLFVVIDRARASSHEEVREAGEWLSAETSALQSLDGWRSPSELMERRSTEG